MEVTAAAKEGAQDLARNVYRDTPKNLMAIAAVLDRKPDADLDAWWFSAVVDWTHRARLILGYDPVLLRHVYGASCPYCSATTVHAPQDGQQVRIPAIGITWSGDEGDEWVVHNVHCHACGATWARGQDLDALVAVMLANNRRAVLS
jgi:hypothetical protein